MFAIRHPLTAMIQDRKIYIEALITDFPNMKASLYAKIRDGAIQWATDIAEGDLDIKNEEYEKYVNAYEESRDFDNLFYQAMLIIVYAYYDGAVERMCKENGIKDTNGDRIEKLCQNHKISLSKNAQEYKTCIYENMKHLRHDVVHNNAGTLANVDTIKNITQRYPEMQIRDNEVIINGPDFILDMLNKEYFVLYELAHKLGYKTKYIGGTK